MRRPGLASCQALLLAVLFCSAAADNLLSPPPHPLLLSPPPGCLIGHTLVRPSGAPESAVPKPAFSLSVKDGFPWLCATFSSRLHRSADLAFTFTVESLRVRLRRLASLSSSTHAFCTLLRFSPPPARYHVTGELYNLSVVSRYDFGSPELPISKTVVSSLVPCYSAAGLEDGYWSREQGAAWLWTSACTGIAGTSARQRVSVLASTVKLRPTWFQVAGDSVIRDTFFLFCMQLNMHRVQKWQTGRNSAFPDFAECSNNVSVATFQWYAPLGAVSEANDLAVTSLSGFRNLFAEWPDTNGSWTKAFDSDAAGWAADDDRRPNATFFTLGYHQSHTSSENLLKYLASALAALDTTPRPVAYLLNVAANTSLVPASYEDDVAARSLPRAAAQNEALLSALRRRKRAGGATVRVVDMFSIELPWNELAHRDAVHLGGLPCLDLGNQTSLPMALAGHMARTAAALIWGWPPVLIADGAGASSALPASTRVLALKKAKAKSTTRKSKAGHAAI